MTNAERIAQLEKELADAKAALELEAMQKQIATLTATVERLVTDRGRGYNTNKYGRNGRHRSNSRSRTRVNENKGLCYYHETFGEKARKCHQPCNYSGN